jgi:hypothetical protein
MKTILLAALIGLNPMSTLAQTPTQPSAMTQAKGTFDVVITPTTHAPDESIASNTLGKTYKGDLEATAKGEMLSSGDPTSGNAGYVAIERITGALAGKTGTFAVMQSGTMSTGVAPQMTATIVPGSGTGDLSGIYGSMAIEISGGKHFYTIYYAFAMK